VDLGVGVIQFIYLAAAVVISFFFRHDGEVWPGFYQSWGNDYCPSAPQFWLLFQAYEREQLRGTIDDCFFFLDTLIDVVCFCIAEQELELHLSDSTIDKITFAVEPRQLALNVRVMSCVLRRRSLTELW
jgi:hypothetical protein